MERSLFALVIGGFSLLSLGLQQSAFAHEYYGGYGRYDHLERDIGHDRAALDRDYAERHYYAEREARALRNGNYFGAWWWGWRRHHEEREINTRRADLYRDHERLERYRY